VAVTVPANSPFLVIDSDDRIVEVSRAAEAVYGSLRGSRLWDRYPEAKPLFRPHFDRARREQEPVEFVQFFRGQVAWLRVESSGSRITLSWEMLFALDTLTLDRLRDSLDAALEILDERQRQLQRSRLRDTFEVIDGGG
jgi:PAS domain-containing protein